MKISIITVNYNNASGLERTIKSVLSQSYSDIEHIVIDGDSTDGSVDVIKSLSDRIAYWCSESDNGIYNAMNKGVAVASGDYCLFLNSGDILYEFDSLEQVISAKPYADIVSCDLICDDHNNRWRYSAHDSVGLAFLLTSSLAHPATLIKTKIIKQLLYREDYRIISDWIFFFESLILNNATYQSVHRDLSIFYRDGISTKQKNLSQEEKRQYLSFIMPERVSCFLYDDYTQYVLSTYRTGDLIKKTVVFVIRSLQWIERQFVIIRRKCSNISY